jgi:excinuclease ABC subunit A
VVITGVSGSGKSSLAFDTIYQEGQRRFMESLSAYARQFLGQMERPKFDSLEGISPTLSIDQKTVNRNPRSTVGTVTEILDHLRLLFARLGTPHCPECGTEVSRLGIDQVVDRILDSAAGERAVVLAPVIRERKGEYRKELDQLRVDGWTRARVDGAMIDLAEPPALARYEKHTIEVVVDRLKVDRADRGRLAEACETAARLAGGSLVVQLPDRENGHSEVAFATARACPNHPEVAIPELEPRLFSFNAPQGACIRCNGLGALEAFAPDRVIDGGRPGSDCVMAFTSDGKIPFAWFDRADLQVVLKALGASPSKLVSQWPASHRQRLLYGDSSTKWTQHTDKNGRHEVRTRPWKGLIPMLEEIWRWAPGFPSLERLRHKEDCPDCHGHRLNPIAREVTFHGRKIWELAHLTVGEADSFFAGLRLVGPEQAIGEQILHEIRGRLSFLREVGLQYLSLDRSSATLSGGEAQRIRLAAQVGSALEGVTYVLDEPSIGLHARDNRRLLGALATLRDRGNTVIVVEHDAETILAADWVVDVGPEAGRNGGKILASGPPGQVAASEGPTGRWLRGEVALGEGRRRIPERWLEVKGARANNLRGIDARFPLGVLCAVTGVSGSGKSSLVFEVLMDAVEGHLEKRRSLTCDALVGAEAIDKLVELSQQPIGRTPRSNPATYVGAFDLIRDLFAATPESKARAYKKGRFSFNVTGGRCEACQGAGVKTVELQFLPSVEVPCEVCGGKRFNAETLEITWKGKTISDVLAMTVDEAFDTFQAIPKLKRILGTLRDVGLGYLPLGQPSTTVSGGEAQRIKIATELQRPATGHTLYLLDEPTTGLHFSDVARLVAALQRLVDEGNSVIVVEHHTDVILCADHVVDLGPEGGEAGGKVIGQGPPAAIARLDSPTGRVLAALTAGEAPVAQLVAAERIIPYATGPTRAGELRVTGARVHNLRGLDVAIPHGKLTVITGPSGSGKTSLAFDTLFAEGQRQYVESLSTYARRFLGRLDRAPVDRIEGLQPAIAIDQASGGHNPRSTVATVTEIADVLRLLWAKVGVAHCPVCKREIRGYDPSDAAGRLRELAPGPGWLLARLSPSEDGEGRRKTLISEGWTRIWGKQGEVALEEPAAAKLLTGEVRLVIDRFDPAREPRSRVSEAIAAAYRVGGDRTAFRVRSDGAEHVFGKTADCPEHGTVHAGELTPKHFSFNSQLGACKTCEGLGIARSIAPERLFPHPDLGLWEALDGRVATVLTRSSRTKMLLEAVLSETGSNPRQPVKSWSEATRSAVLEGLARPISLKWSRQWGASSRKVVEDRVWAGLIPTIEGWSGRLDWLFAETTCRACRGGRLRKELLAVTVGGVGIDRFSRLDVEAALATATSWSFAGEAAAIAERPVLELTRRLGFLRDVGLAYLGLDRAADSLSGGESQRIRLASQLGSALTGTTYVLDEPTIGLHPRDTERLLATLTGLRDLGNTVILVEHDPETIQRADHVVDLGPGAGIHGGQVVASGSPAEISRDPRSLTGRWLSGAEKLPVRAERREPRGFATVVEPVGNNLRGGKFEFPLGVWCSVTGVSGSGKSTLVMDTLAPALQARLGAHVIPAAHKEIRVDLEIDKVVVVDQQPIGRTPRSTPATFTGVFDALRKLFAETPAARQRGWSAGRFSYNTPGGRCEICEGRGAILIEMHFLPDVWVTCDGCQGRRSGRETLEVRWKDRSIADILAMRCDEAADLFSAQRAIKRQLEAMVDVGLGYLTLGQPATTLSGGEAQRVKLASELAARRGHAVYVLDEPTTGLHLADVARLVDVLHRLVDSGHSVVTIEHHLGMIGQSDWVIDLGPDGGGAGGRLVGAGTPEQIARLDTPTGRAIAADRPKPLKKARSRAASSPQP